MTRRAISPRFAIRIFEGTRSRDARPTGRRILRAMADPPASPGVQWHIRRFTEIDSTNRYVLDAARAGAPPGLVVVADHQHAGRGRRGRAWTAPPGSSLLVSVLLGPPTAPDQAQLLAMAAG